MSDFSDFSSDDDNEEFRRSPRVFRERGNPFIELSDKAFKMRFRLTKHTVEVMEGRLREALMRRSNRNQPLSPMFQILLTLRFYATGSFQIVVSDLFQIDTATVCRVIHKVTREIAALRPQFISMPTDQREARIIMRQFYDIAHFPGIIGAIDCTHVPIKSPGGNNAEVFRNRHGWFSLNVQAICDANLRCLDIVARWSGSAHDSNIFDNSRIHARFEAGEMPKGYLLGDSAYRCCEYLLTPVLNEATPAEIAYNRAHRGSRSTIERTFGVVKRRFPCLKVGLQVKLRRVPNIIVAVFVLHNMALDSIDDEPEVEGDVLAGRRIFEEVPVFEEHGLYGGNNTAVRNEIINNVFRR